MTPLVGCHPPYTSRDRPHLGGLLWEEGVDQVGRFLVLGRAIHVDLAQLFHRAVAEDQVQKGQGKWWDRANKKAPGIWAGAV